MLSTRPAQFAAHLRQLRDGGATVLSLHDGVERLRRGDLPQRAVAITFDDGFRSVLEHALPLLSQYRFPATVFVVSGYVGATNDWPSQPAMLARQPLLDWSEIVELADAGIEIGAHSHTHAHLPGLSRAAIEEEILGSRQRIEDHIGRSVRAFAYPYGEYDRDVIAAASAHVSIACSTDLGIAVPTSDPMALERLDTYYLRPLWAVRALFSGPMRAYIAMRRLAREVRARAARS